MTDQFSHEALDHSLQSLRLVHILPDLSPEGLIQCTISHSTIGSDYVCLSYAWGDSEWQRKIIINGKPFFVRKNLFKFLSVGRVKRPSPQALWIDALCIDQGNIRERNHQVQQMGRIYSQAKEVLVWIGISQDESPSRRRGKIPFLEETVRTSIIPFGPTRRDFWSSREELRKELSTILRMVMCDRYWDCAWIVQEILLARAVILLIDEEEISIHDFIANVEACIGTISRGWLQSGLFRCAGYMGESLSLCGEPLLNLLSRFFMQQCSIPRDRIFRYFLYAELGPARLWTTAFRVPISCSRSSACLKSSSASVQPL